MSKRLQTGGRLTSGWDLLGSELCSKSRNDVTFSSELRLLRSEGGELRTGGALGPEDAGTIFFVCRKKSSLSVEKYIVLYHDLSRRISVLS